MSSYLFASEKWTDIILSKWLRLRHLGRASILDAHTSLLRGYVKNEPHTDCQPVLKPDDPSLQHGAGFLAICACLLNHVHSCAYDPMIVLHEDLKIEHSRKHSIFVSY
jgi:hypothetical protein